MKYKLLITTSFTLALLTFAAAARLAMPDSGPVPMAAEPLPTPAGKAAKPASSIALIDGEFDGVVVVKSDEEWKRILTPTEYHIIREEGTERPYSGELLNNKKRGTYHCAACGLALFSSAAKYDSETG